MTLLFDGVVYDVTKHTLQSIDVISKKGDVTDDTNDDGMTDQNNENSTHE